MRDIGPSHRVQQAVSHDAGRHWEDAPPLEIPNRDDSVAALRLANGGYVLLHNDTLPGGSPRQWLRLSTSADAQAWTPALDVQRGRRVLVPERAAAGPATARHLHRAAAGDRAPGL
jgi:hypothetical protein